MFKQLYTELKTDPQLKWVKRFWILCSAGLISIVLLLSYTATTGIPSFETLENPNYKLATEIYDINGVSFGSYYVENRIPVSFEQLNPHIKNAVVFTEDERFFQHSGVDIPALGRVAIKTILLSKETSGGGSTLTQQLAKLLFDRPSTRGLSTWKKLLRLIPIKMREWLTAVKLERSYTKEEILSMYLNKFEFINGAHGIQAAAKVYFNKDQADLLPEEAALLVGMLKNPSLYNPVRFPEKAKRRRNTVLSIMKANRYIKGTNYDSLMALEIDMSKFRKEEQSFGPAPYFRAELTKYIQNLIREKNLKRPDGSLYNIYTDGLKIHTTIDLKYQQYAEEASKDHMAWLQKRYFRQWKGMDPWTYQADDFQKAIRKEALISKAKSSPRYLALRKKLFEPVVAGLEDIKTSDNILETLIKSDTNSLIINDLYKNAWIQKEELSKYLDFKKSPDFARVRKAYEELQKAFRESFSKKVKMKVFDYAKGEKDTLMSPMDSTRFSAMFLQNAVLAINPTNGHVKAWVGGIDHKHFKFDHVTSRRSVGSTMKPFVYTAAMAFGGIMPCQEYEDIQYTIAPGDANFNVDKEWTPNNATEEFTGNMYNLYHGLVYSKNSITVRLLKEMGSVDLLRNLLDKVGISKTERLSNGRLAVPEFPSICLGAVDISLYQMTAAYTTFANQGTYREPVFVLSITDKNGREIYRANPTIRPAINPLYNAIMVDMLKNVVGGDFAMGLKTENGGKTGTTNDYSDGWFMGVTPTLVVGVWTGGDDKWIRFTNLNDGQGYVTARPVFQKLIKKLESDTTGIYDYKVRFAPAPEGMAEMIDCDKVKTVRPAAERWQTQKEKMKRDEFEEDF